MLLLAALSVVLLTLAAVGGVCDRWGPPDPTYAMARDVVRRPAAGQRPGPDPARRPSTAA